ncbi:phenylacetyl-ligase [Coniochaeta sp. 2T2.1]|nr:phenylacetyl-ligase [Coniochaeta sp. 2T2.1]
MVFHSPSWVPDLPLEPPDSIPIAQFMSEEVYGRCPPSQSRNPFTCGLTGKTYSVSELFQRSEHLARAISKRLNWQPYEGTCWDKVVGIFALNSIDYITAAYGVHRLSGIVTTANAVYSAAELEHHLRSSGTQVLITCVPLLETALQAAKAAGFPSSRIFLLEISGSPVNEASGLATIDDLISEGKGLPALEPLQWVKGQGARQPAFLCYSSGTSGLPKAVMISHKNIIANVLQHSAYESVGRAQKGVSCQTVLGILPFSHIYALIVAAHTATYRGDEVIVLPKYEFEGFLAAVERFRISLLIVVPPMIIQMLRGKEVCKKYDLGSVRFVFSGAAPLGEETMKELEQLIPTCTVAQAYGMTETSVVVSAPSEHDVVKRTAGSLLPRFKAKLMDFDGKEVTGYNIPGELLIQGPSVTLGYLNNAKATAETFVHDDDGRWIRTGDEAIFELAPSGNEHLVIVDRIKELIKVKGHQVAPAELEAHLLTHPAVADCAVIQIPDERSGEVPKAFVVKAPDYLSKPDVEVAQTLDAYVAEHKAPYKWLKGGVEFLHVIPKSPSGKILRRLLRDRERDERRSQGGRL